MRLRFLFLLAFVFLTISQVNAAQSHPIIIRETGLRTYLYIPDSYDSDVPVPLVIALHGMGEYAEGTFKVWLPIAKSLGFILACPQGSVFQSGYSRAPTDDRKEIVAIKSYLEARYSIDPHKILLAGFSRGGNFAIETGGIYPESFPKTLCIFGFFTQTAYSIFRPRKGSEYPYSHFYIFTGTGDLTESSARSGSQYLQNMGIVTTLIVSPTLKHRYPPTLDTIVKDILKI